MIFAILSLALHFSQSALAKEFDVIPLNSTAEKVLKSSSLSAQVGSFDQSQVDFHQKTILIYERIAPFIDFKKVDALDFIYDSRFLTESTFANKYPAISKSSLSKARRVASEVYSK